VIIALDEEFPLNLGSSPVCDIYNNIFDEILDTIININILTLAPLNLLY